MIKGFLITISLLHSFILVRDDGQRALYINTRKEMCPQHKHGLVLPSGGRKRTYGTADHRVDDSLSVVLRSELSFVYIILIIVVSSGV